MQLPTIKKKSLKTRENVFTNIRRITCLCKNHVRIIETNEKQLNFSCFFCCQPQNTNFCHKKRHKNAPKTHQKRKKCKQYIKNFSKIFSSVNRAFDSKNGFTNVFTNVFTFCFIVLCFRYLE